MRADSRRAAAHEHVQIVFRHGFEFESEVRGGGAQDGVRGGVGTVLDPRAAHVATTGGERGARGIEAVERLADERLREGGRGAGAFFSS